MTHIRDKDHHGDSRDSQQRYGLLKRGDESSASAKDYSGPRPDLLRLKEDREAQDSAARNKPRESTKQLSEEEKMRRLSDMQRDAALNDAMRFGRHKSGGVDGSKSESTSKADPSFLQSMRNTVYVEATGSMEDRVKQNKYYMQKAADMDSEGFLKR
jgi:hypothetical protein